MTPAELIEDTADYATRLGEVAAVVKAAVKGGEATAAQLEAVRATTSGLEVDIRTTLRELDRCDETDWLVVVDGERTLAIWTWRRASRSALLGLWRLAHQMAEAARELGGGTRQRIVVVRDGETWQSIAARELGSWGEWPRLLAANPALSPGALPSGTTLVVPDKR